MNYVALDIGNVLVHCDFDSFISKLSKALNITKDEATYFMNRSQKLHDLGLTVMTDELKDHFKIRSEAIIEELVDAWNGIIVADLAILDKLNRMIDKSGLQVALLSNVGLEHAVRMERILSYGGFFQRAIKHFSCHVGARKPTLIYYHTFLELHPEWQGCPYIDDLQENLDASKQFGFKTLRFSLAENRSIGLYDRPTILDANYRTQLEVIQNFILNSNKA